MTDGDQKTEKVKGVRCIEVVFFFLFNEYELVCTRKKRIKKNTSPCSMSVRSDHMKPFSSSQISLIDLSDFDSLTIRFFAPDLRAIIKQLHDYSPYIWELLEHKHKAPKSASFFPILSNCSKSNPLTVFFFFLINFSHCRQLKKRGRWHFL